jgi:hypothetical protein
MVPGANRIRETSVAALDLIVIAGAPGSGKSTVCELLKSRLGSPYIEFSALREPHLDRQWSNESVAEEAMSFETLVCMLDNYWRHGYRDVILTDLKDERVQAIPSVFSARKFAIFTLVLHDDRELGARISQRRQGFVNVGAALAWNSAVRARPTVPGEAKLVVDGHTPGQVADAIVKLRETIRK